MMDRYGVANGDLGQLQRAIESDETYWEAAAEDAGMSTEQYKAFAQMKRENGQMRQALEQRQRQQSVEAQLQRWYSQAEEARQAYPDLDLERESQDPRFLGMLKAGVPVQHAYEVIHMDAIKAGRRPERGPDRRPAGDGQRAGQRGETGRERRFLRQRISRQERRVEADEEGPGGDRTTGRPRRKDHLLGLEHPARRKGRERHDEPEGTDGAGPV